MLKSVQRTATLWQRSLHTTACCHTNTIDLLLDPVLPNRVDAGSADFKARHDSMNQAIAKLERLHHHIADGIPEKVRIKHLSKNKLLPRDRLARLVDPGTGFLELSPLAGHEMYDDDIRAGGIIAGIGLVHGHKVLIVANDSTVKGGTYYPITVRKHLRAQEIAKQHRLPCLYLADSGGANLPHQADVFPGHEHFGRIFFQQSQMSGLGIPQLALVLGPCTAGGAYVPAMSDEAIMVKGTGHVFLGGPPLVKAATGEVVDAETLGGADMHTSVSGVADYMVSSEEEGIARMRQLVQNLASVERQAAQFPVEEPLYDANELGGIVGTNLRTGFEVRDVISRIVDGSRFVEFKPRYGTTLVCGWSSIWGHRVGIVANNGPILSEAALKGAHFIQLCSKRQIPLVFLQNVSGFMVGKDAERGGIAKNGAKLVTAVVGANVDKYTVLIGGSYGAGNYGMCGRAFEPRFLWSWPNSRTAVMGSEQLASVMAAVSSKPDQELQQRIDRESEAVFGSARLWDDGVIRPQDTRSYLGRALDLRVPQQEREFGVWRM